MNAINKFLLYVNDMALSRLTPDEMVDYLNYKDHADAELSALAAQIAALKQLVEKWRKDANAMVPEVYSSRNLHSKYFKLDNEAAGMMTCVDELEDIFDNEKELTK